MNYYRLLKFAQIEKYLRDEKNFSQSTINQIIALDKPKQKYIGKLLNQKKDLTENDVLEMLKNINSFEMQTDDLNAIWNEIFDNQPFTQDDFWSKISSDYVPFTQKILLAKEQKPEDLRYMLEVYNNFEKLKKKNVDINRDINQYKSFAELVHTINEFSVEDKATAYLRVDPKKLDGVTSTKSGPYTIYKVTNPISLSKMGKNTKWCTREDYEDCQSDYYIKEYGAIYIVTRGAQFVAQFTPNFSQFQDVDNLRMEKPKDLNLDDIIIDLLQTNKIHSHAIIDASKYMSENLSQKQIVINAIANYVFENPYHYKNLDYKHQQNPRINAQYEAGVIDRINKDPIVTAVNFGITKDDTEAYAAYEKSLLKHLRQDPRDYKYQEVCKKCEKGDQIDRACKEGWARVIAQKPEEIYNYKHAFGEDAELSSVAKESAIKKLKQDPQFYGWIKRILPEYADEFFAIGKKITLQDVNVIIRRPLRLNDLFRAYDYDKEIVNVYKNKFIEHINKVPRLFFSEETVKNALAIFKRDPEIQDAAIQAFVRLIHVNPTRYYPEAINWFGEIEEFKQAFEAAQQKKSINNEDNLHKLSTGWYLRCKHNHQH